MTKEGVCFYVLHFIFLNDYHVQVNSVKRDVREIGSLLLYFAGYPPSPVLIRHVVSSLLLVLPCTGLGVPLLLPVLKTLW